MAIMDTDPASPDYGKVVGWSKLPTAGTRPRPGGSWAW